jgi:hypothetical protein
MYELDSNASPKKSSVFERLRLWEIWGCGLNGLSGIASAQRNRLYCRLYDVGNAHGVLYRKKFGAELSHIVFPMIHLSKYRKSGLLVLLERAS